MLVSLDIKNIALIDNLEAEFADGLNILTGETGAGKSIIIDSLEFVLGERADKSLIRYGCDSASVTALFQTSQNSPAAALLEESGIELDGGEILLARTMSVDGKNVCRINGSRVTLGVLRSIAHALADIYGQHEATGLLSEENHIKVLDKFAGEALAQATAERSTLCAEYYATKREIAEYGSLTDVEAKTEEVKDAIKELQDAALEPGEEDALIAARKKFNNAERIRDALADAQNSLDGDSASAISQIVPARRSMRSVADSDEAYAEIERRLESLKLEAEDVAATLSDLIASDDFDPYAAERCEERLALVRKIKRKYSITEEECEQKLEQLQAELDFLAGGEAALERLNDRLDNIKTKLAKNADTLHSLRQKAAKELGELLVKQLKELGMNNASFAADIERTSGEPDPSGEDKVVFLFSANAGQPLRELVKVISGGELSRFMLAVKNIISDIDGVETMVFDEVDTGISGKTSQVVAEKLYTIAKGRQVLAVTHLPQLASMADKHFLINKFTDKDGAHTALTALDEKGMLGEIARLIGGSEYSSHALPHAEEMKRYADEFKKR